MGKRNKSKVIAKRREGKAPGVSKYAEKKRAKRASLANRDFISDSPRVSDKENGKGRGPHRECDTAWSGPKPSSVDRGCSRRGDM